MITLANEEAQQVLDALNSCGEDYIYDGEDEQRVDVYDYEKVDAAINLLRARLAQPEPELWAGVDFDVKTAPPQREWQGLKAYEIQEIHLANSNWGNFACAIEAKLKEKNAA